MDFLKNISSKYEMFWKNIIEPQRQQYSLSDLGQNIRMMHNTTVLRKDIQVKNDRGEILECTYFLPDNMIKEKKLPFVIYLHGNSGSRVEAVSTLQHLIPTFGLFCFDFSGSGKSQGKYVTMGINECRDLESIVKYVEDNLTQNQIIIWGRSMGAVTGILYTSKNQSRISGLVLDSPFSDLKKVMQEIASTKTKIPSLIVEGVITLMKSKIQETLQGVDIFDTQILEKIKYIEIPILFAYGTKDTIILPYHSQNLHKACRSDNKQIIEFEGNHNTIRPNHFFSQIVQFIQQICMRRPFIKQLNNPINYQIGSKGKQHNASDAPYLINQQIDNTPLSNIRNFNINDNNFYETKNQQNLLNNRPAEQKAVKNEGSKYSINSQFTSPLLHQKLKEKEQQKSNVSFAHQISNDRFQDLTPKGINQQQNQSNIIHGHVKANSISGLPQSKGISLISYQQRDIQQNINFSQAVNNENINRGKPEQNIQQKQQQESYLQFNEQINTQPTRPVSNNRKDSETKPARKKIFQDNFSERKQPRVNQQNQGTNIGQSLQINQTNQPLSTQKNKTIMDNTDQYISNQLYLLQDITNENIMNGKSPISSSQLNPENQGYINQFQKNSSTSALSPTAKLTIPNVDNQTNINFSRGLIGQSIINSQVQISPFLAESQNFQDIQNHNNNNSLSRLNNFVSRSITPTRQQQNLIEPVKKSSNYISCRQYSLDGGSSQNNPLSNYGKDLSDYYQYGIQFNNKNEQIKRQSLGDNIQPQSMQHNNTPNEQWIQQQFCSLERNINIPTQQSQQKIESYSEQQSIPKTGSAFDWNNSSFEAMNQSYLNPTKNPFQLNNIQSQNQSKIKMINNNNNSNSQIIIQPHTPHHNSNVRQQQQQLVQQQLNQKFETIGDTSPLTASNVGYKHTHSGKTDKQSIIDSQINYIRETESQERIKRQNIRSRNLSAFNGVNNGVNSIPNHPNEQVLTENQNNQNIVINLAQPPPQINYVSQQQPMPQNSGRFNLVLTQSTNIPQNQILRDRQTLSPSAASRNVSPAPLLQNVNVINYGSSAYSAGQKPIANMIQIQQPQNPFQNQPLSPFPIVLNSANQKNYNVQRRFSGIENNNDKLQYISVFTQNLQNRTQREKEFNQQSQRGQLQFVDKRYVCSQENKIAKNQQHVSLFEKVMSDLQNKNTVIEQGVSNSSINTQQIQPKPLHQNNTIMTRQPHYESTSMAECMQPATDQNEKPKITNHFDSHLPISHQVTHLFSKQIELHTNFSNEEPVYSID